jgi:spore coat protein JB
MHQLRKEDEDMRKSIEKDSTGLLHELQALDFALVELTLYLDTHPDDANAIKQHKQLAEQRHDIREKLEAEDGALSSYEANSDKSNWRWSLAPWPWQV